MLWYLLHSNVPTQYHTPTLEPSQTVPAMFVTLLSFKLHID